MALLLLAVGMAYLLGSLPMGYLVVRALTGQDVRKFGSGRTGGTNAMRAAGPLAGLLTGVLDVLKAAAAVWLAAWLLRGEPVIVDLGQALAGLGAIVGHIYSVVLGFKGGAGGAACLGAALGLWPVAGLIAFPVGLAVFYFVGYASLTTLSFGLTATALFVYRYSVLGGPAEFAWFAVGADLLLLWTLRPNLVRLARGEERAVGLRAKRQKQQQQQQGS